VLADGVFWYLAVLTLSPYGVLALITRLGSRNFARSVVVLVSSVFVAVLGIGSVIYASFIERGRLPGLDIFFAVGAEWIVCGLTAVVIACIPARVASLSTFAYGRWTARIIECTLAIWVILYLVAAVIGGGLELWAVLLGWLPGWVLGASWESYARKKARASESVVHRSGSSGAKSDG